MTNQKLTVEVMNSKIGEMFSQKIEQQKKLITAIYSPFSPDELQDVFAEILKRHEAYTSKMPAELYKMTDIPVDKRLPIAKKELMDVQNLEKHFEEIYKSPDFKDFSYSDNFLGKQHVLYFIDDAQAEAVKRFKEAPPQLSIDCLHSDQGQGKEVLLLRYHPCHRKIYAFLAGGVAKIFSSDGVIEGSTNLEKKPVSVDVFDKFTLIGLEDGTVLLCETSSLEKPVYKERFTMYPKEVFIASPNIFFISFEGEKTIVMDRFKFVGWKKDFSDVRVLGLTRKATGADTTFTLTQCENFMISKFEGENFRSKVSVKTGLIDRRSIYVQQDDKKVFVVNKKVVLVISYDKYSIVKKIDLEALLQGPLIVTGVTFFKELTFAVRLFSQKVALVNYALGKVTMSIDLPEKESQIGEITCVEDHLFVSCKGNVLRLKEEKREGAVAPESASKET